MNLTLGISTCPNDTYIFGPLINNFIDSKYKFQTVMDDVEVLNRIALKGNLDIIKVSYGVVPEILDSYYVLKSGGALGFGCGPLLVSKSAKNIKNLKGKRIGIPGINTSALRIFKYFYGSDNFQFVEMRFDLIMPAIVSGNLDAGIIIHEGRFTFTSLGLNKICDLGELWEDSFSGPIPLGAIVIKKELVDKADYINNLIRSSIEYSNSNFEEIPSFIKKYALEMEDDVIRKHIGLFVNKYSSDLSGAVDMLSEFLDCDISSFV